MRALVRVEWGGWHVRREHLGKDENHEMSWDEIEMGSIQECYWECLMSIYNAIYDNIKSFIS
jgi:hypothetical protein